MAIEEPNKMTFQEFLGKLSILLILIAVYLSLRVVVEYGFGYKNFPFLLCAFAISVLIEAIRLKNKKVICTVIAVEIFIGVCIFIFPLTMHYLNLIVEEIKNI